jgi:hypothetical protein
VRKGILLVMGGLALLAGCGNQQDKASGIPVEPKWKGAPYRLAIDAKAPKPDPSGATIPGIKYTANPAALEKRAVIVIRFDDLGVTKTQPTMNKMILAPIDISGAEASIPADYLAAADKDLGHFLAAYCVKGKVKLSVAIARSSLTYQAPDAEVDAKRLSDWMPVELVFKNPKPKC